MKLTYKNYRRTFENHCFHIVDPSPWPFLSSCSIFLFITAFVMYLHFFEFTHIRLKYSFIALALVVHFWFSDIIIEATFEGQHTFRVEKGLKLGVILFIVSEIMLFLSFFSVCVYTFDQLPPFLFGKCWPPKGIEAIDPRGIPLLNSVLLLSSSLFITASHSYILLGDRSQTINYLILTIVWGLFFTVCQYIEYVEAKFSINDSIYGSLFFMLTGLHGSHVILGTICLIVSLIRMIDYQLFRDQHLGYEASVFYWHFVDVVWIFVYTILYIIDF